MRDDDLALAATRRLPPAAVAGLRQAFAAELDERLPRLRDAVERLGAGDPGSLTEAVRDAHALGSSAAVVNEPEASRAARAAEAALLATPLDLPAARAGVDDLDRHLAGWSP